MLLKEAGQISNEFGLSEDKRSVADRYYKVTPIEATKYLES
jgi:hypothetical protein